MDNVSSRLLVKVGQSTYFSDEVKADRKAEFSTIGKFSATARLYMRMLKDGCAYSSCKIVNQRSFDSYAKLSNGIYIKIIAFIFDENTNQTLCLCNKITTIESDHSEFVKFCAHISPDTTSVKIDEIEKICVFVEMDGVSFITACPNLLNY